jgi:hypothetical protein
MKKLILLLVLFTMYSCSLDFETDTRVAIKGIVTDPDNNPLTDIHVFVIAKKGQDGAYLGCIGCDSKIIMRGKTNAKGEFLLFSPKVENALVFHVYINASEDLKDKSSLNPVYKNIRLLQLLPDVFSNNLHDLGTQTLELR